MAARIHLHGGPIHLRISSGYANSLRYDIYLKDAAEPHAAAVPVCRDCTDCPATYLLSPHGAGLDGEWLTWIIHVVDPERRASAPYDVRIEVEQDGRVVAGGSWGTPTDARMEGAITVIEQMDFEVLN
jgi:hypothetical protein